MPTKPFRYRPIQQRCMTGPTMKDTPEYTLSTISVRRKSVDLYRLADGDFYEEDLDLVLVLDLILELDFVLGLVLDLDLDTIV